MITSTKLLRTDGPRPSKTVRKPNGRPEAIRPWSLALVTIVVLASSGLAATAPAPGHTDYYTVEDIVTPPNVVNECGGIAFLPDGRLVAVFHHGEVYFYTPATKEWHLFAEGLHDPMGVLPISATE